MKKILILNGSPRKNGKTASLAKAFVEGAKSAGQEVKEMYIDGMSIASCKACEYCQNTKARGIAFSRTTWCRFTRASLGPMSSYSPRRSTGALFPANSR